MAEVDDEHGAGRMDGKRMMDDFNQAKAELSRALLASPPGRFIVWLVDGLTYSRRVQIVFGTICVLWLATLFTLAFTTR